MIRAIRQFFKSIKRFFYWGWKMRHNYDWDHVFLLEVIHLKLKRMEHYQINHGMSVDSEDPRSTMRKALRTSIRLCERLIERDPMFYSERLQQEFENKWGKINTWSTPIEGKPDMSQLHIQREHVNDENHAQYWEESKELYKKQSMLYHRDKRLFFRILEKHIEEFWD
jgi:hypothetical protein